MKLNWNSDNITHRIKCKTQAQNTNSSLLCTVAGKAEVVTTYHVIAMCTSDFPSGEGGGRELPYGIDGDARRKFWI